MPAKPLPVHGVDISHHQNGVLDFKAAQRAGVRFVYHKATEGSTYTDPLYRVRRAQAKAAGVHFGAYHFARPSRGKNDAVAEATHFLNTARPEAGDMIPVLDLEVNDEGMSKAELTEWVLTFHSVIVARTGSRRMVLYTPFDLIRVPIGTRLWVARYSDSNTEPNVPEPFVRYHIRQFSNGQLGVPDSVAGFGHVDLNTLHSITLARAKIVRFRNLRISRRKKTPEPNVPAVGEQAIREFQPGIYTGVGMCLMEVREAFHIDRRYASATEAWTFAKKRHKTSRAKDIPRGYPVFWTGGSKGFGHIAISLGDGYCLSTDILRRGRVDRVKIDTITSRWGLRLVGWTEDLNGVTVR